MLYFKNIELAKKYHVSLGAVRNWIRAAQAGKLDLTLHEEDKVYIANTNSNVAIMDQLAEKRKKFRNSRSIKTVSPKPAFYELFTQKQIFDIASNLDIRSEIPFQYGYFDGGANYWDRYAKRLAVEKLPNFLNSTILQLDMNQKYIDQLTSRYNKINVIDIGPGNVLPVKGLLEHLLKQGKMGRYIALDISSAMLEIAKQNIKSWFGNSIPIEVYEADINYDRFTELIVQDAIGRNAKHTINLVLALGGTFANLRAPNGAFKVIHDSMNRNDLLIYNLKLDTYVARQYFDFGIEAKMPPLDIKSKMILDMLSIDEPFYDVEMGYDSQLRERYIRIRLKVALNIKFRFDNGDRIVEFNKNDAILLWRYWHQNAPEVIDQLNQNDFDVLQTSLTEDMDYLLVVSRLKGE